MGDLLPLRREGLNQDKAALRERMRAIRRGIAPAGRTRLAEEAARRLAELPELSKARLVMVFASFGAEISTEPAIARLAGRGRRLLLPYLVEGSMDAAEFDPGEPLEATAYGPKEPARRVAADPSAIDLVVVPGLAFDRAGHRLGYGGGHYDRYLGRLRHDALRVGICFHAQLVDLVPHGPADRRVHVVVTDREAIDCHTAG